MAKAYILALDQGTTSSRAIIFDETGQIVSMAQKEFPQHYPQPGWVEHNPEDLWATQSSSAVEALTRAHLKPSDIVALGITNQRETTLVWDRKTLTPIYPAIVWQDRRTAPITDALKERGLESIFKDRTGLVLDPYFSGTKIQWILDHVPGARQKADRGELAFGTVDSWLLANLTQGKVHATDPSNASRTLLYNIHKKDWDEELLTLLNIPRSLLPEVKPSSGLFGTCEGLLEGIPIHGVAGDQQAALFGQACFEVGMAKNTYGTGCFLLMNTGSRGMPSSHGLLTTVAWQIENEFTYALEGSVFIGGAVIQWLRDGLSIILKAEESETLARTVENSGGVSFVPAFTGLGAPHWDPHARGAILGLTRGTTKGHIARAALEAIALQSADILKAMEQDAHTKLQALKVDGGAVSNELLLEIQAHILGTPVIRSECQETTAWGAACLAGLSAKIWPNKNGIPLLSQGKTFSPAPMNENLKQMMAQWQHAMKQVQLSNRSSR